VFELVRFDDGHVAPGSIFPTKLSATSVPGQLDSRNQWVASEPARIDAGKAYVRG
jgi:hypothetical protein